MGIKIVSSEFYFHKLITVHIELSISFLSFHTFLIVHRSLLTTENLIKVEAQQSF